MNLNQVHRLDRPRSRSLPRGMFKLPMPQAAVAGLGDVEKGTE